MPVEYKRIKLSELHEDPANARIHPEENLADIRASLKEFGQVEPLVVQKNSGKVIGGNGRLKVMRELGWDECDIAYVDFDNMKSTALGIALNRAGERAEWDKETLDKLLAEIEDIDEELAASFAELEKECGIEEPPGEADAEPQIDRAAELQKKWGTATGQLWLIGEHRLLCGDSTKREDVERVMGGQRAEILFTSPPYADMREYSGNDLSIEMLARVFTVWNAVAFYCVNLGLQFKNDEIYEYWDEWIKSARQAGLKLLSWNIWDRINATSVSSQLKMFAITHEFIFVFGKFSKELNRTWEKSEESQKREQYYGVNANGQKVTTRRQADGTVKESVIGTIYDNKNMGTVFTGFAEMERSIDHPAKFPIELPTGYIGAMTNQGEIIAEPFAGSGTTLVAAQNLSRRCYGIEISPAYCAVILERMQTAFPALDIRQA